MNLRPMTFLIVYEEGGERWAELGQTTRIGRDPRCDLILADSTVSARHCQIERLADSHLLIDVGSRNGTYLNRVRLGGVVLLSHRDEIRIGRTSSRPIGHSISVQV